MDELVEKALSDRDEEEGAPGKTEFNIFSQWKNPPLCDNEVVEPNGYITDAAGYIPAKEQIENLIAAGHRLHEWRASMYTNEPTPDDVEIDPTTRKDFDFAAAHEEMVSVDASLKAAKAAADKKAKEDAEAASKASTEPPEGASEEPAEPPSSAGGQ